MSLAVANQYAKALLEAALAPNSGLDPQVALDQVMSFNAAVRESKELHELLLTPAVSHVKKRNALGRVAEMMGLHRLVLNFISVVVKNRRLSLMDPIAEMYRALLDERNGVVRAHVKSARPLNEAQIGDLQQRLTQATGKQVACDFQVQPSLIGGVMVTIGSTVYDGSVVGQLGAMQRRLAGEA